MPNVRVCLVLLVMPAFAAPSFGQQSVNQILREAFADDSDVTYRIKSYPSEARKEQGRFDQEDEVIRAADGRFRIIADAWHENPKRGRHLAFRKQLAWNGETAVFAQHSTPSSGPSTFNFESVVQLGNSPESAGAEAFRLTSGAVFEGFLWLLDRRLQEIGFEATNVEAAAPSDAPGAVIRGRSEYGDIELRLENGRLVRLLLHQEIGDRVNEETLPITTGRDTPAEDQIISIDTVIEFGDFQDSDAGLVALNARVEVTLEYGSRGTTSLVDRALRRTPPVRLQEGAAAAQLRLTGIPEGSPVDFITGTNRVEMGPWVWYGGEAVPDDGSYSAAKIDAVAERLRTPPGAAGASWWRNNSLILLLLMLGLVGLCGAALIAWRRRRV